MNGLEVKLHAYVLFLQLTSCSWQLLSYFLWLMIPMKLEETDNYVLSIKT